MAAQGRDNIPNLLDLLPKWMSTTERNDMHFFFYVFQNVLLLESTLRNNVGYIVIINEV